MGHVIAFKAKTEDGPTGMGEAICMECQHKWHAVAPVGAWELECPQCHTMKGHWIFAYSTPEGQVLEHHCGNNLFNITPNGTFCPKCGEYLRL